MKALKYVVVDEPLSEADVHPPDSYRQLVELSVSSAAELRERRDVDCPACGSPQRQLAFDKSGYTYWSCCRCTTLFASPRPTGALLDWYLHESPAARFRTRQDYRRPLKRRALEVAGLQGEWVLELLERSRQPGSLAGPVVDLHTRFPEYFELLRQQGLDTLIAVDPLCPLPDSLTADGGLRRLDDLTQLGESECQILTAFNALEHLEEPAALARDAFRALAPGGLLALTTRSSSGLDIQVLWQRCPTIFPADHLNLLSVEGVRTLLETAGFELLEVSTPGQLDVELVARVLDEDQDTGSSPSQRTSDSGATRFLRYLLSHRGADARSGLQHFLQQHLLSSHLRVIARKPVTRRTQPARGDA